MKHQKVCIITCYNQPDYVRAIVLRRALAGLTEVETIVVKNSRRGLLRYPEVILKVFWIRLTKRPDSYLVTFRGYEILPFIRIIAVGKKLIFDEFINLEEWVVYEHKKLSVGSLSAKLLHNYYKLLLRLCGKILADTKVHANFSAKLMDIPADKYLALPVGTDEELFRPQKNKAKSRTFEVLYYGSMLPLHGLDLVGEAAVELGQTDVDVRFTIIGGGEKAKKDVENWAAQGAKVSFNAWVPFADLINYVYRSDLCLGGPFGATIQSSMVITGKTFQFLAAAKPTLVGKINESTPLKDKKNCLLIEQGTSRAIIQSIKWAKSHRAELQTIGREGRKVFEEHYSTAVIARMIKPLIVDEV